MWTRGSAEKWVELLNDNCGPLAVDFFPTREFAQRWVKVISEWDGGASLR